MRRPQDVERQQSISALFCLVGPYGETDNTNNNDDGNFDSNSMSVRQWGAHPMGMGWDEGTITHTASACTTGYAWRIFVSVGITTLGLLTEYNCNCIKLKLWLNNTPLARNAGAPWIICLLRNIGTVKSSPPTNAATADTSSARRNHSADAPAIHTPFPERIPRELRENLAYFCFMLAHVLKLV